MTRAAHHFPLPDQLPIPRDVQVGPGWGAQMREMADHIGPYATLLIVDRWGGQQVYVAADPARNVFRDAIGAAAAETMSRIYGRETLKVPTGKPALAQARRAPIIAAVRAGEMTGAEAAARLRVNRTYISELINQRDEWDLPLHEQDRRRVLAALDRRDPRNHPEDWADAPSAGRRRSAGQMELFDEGEAE